MSVRKSQGFTLIEMVVTMALMVIIAGIAVPSFQHMLANNRVTAVSEELVASFSEARNTAITRRRTVLLLPTTTGWTLQLVDNTTTPPSRTILKSHEVKSPVVVTFDPFTAGMEVAFLANGQVQRKLPTPVGPLDWTIKICDSSVSDETGRGITLSRVGRIGTSRHANSTACKPS